MRAMIRLITMLPLGVFVATTAEAGAIKSWDKIKDGPGRFKILSAFDDAAALDKETGLVWQLSPSPTLRSPEAASAVCSGAIGGRHGWRLPTVGELSSLIDATQGPPTLVSGHPFSNIGGGYWTTSTTLNSLGNLRLMSVNFDFGIADVISPGDDTEKAWCVRGPE